MFDDAQMELAQRLLPLEFNRFNGNLAEIAEVIKAHHEHRMSLIDNITDSTVIKFQLDDESEMIKSIIREIGTHRGKHAPGWFCSQPAKDRYANYACALSYASHYLYGRLEVMNYQSYMEMRDEKTTS